MVMKREQKEPGRRQREQGGCPSVPHTYMKKVSYSVSREWQPLLVADSGTAVLDISAFASLCKRQPTIILSSVLQCLDVWALLLIGMFT
jgi:hypothetical protein